MKRILYISTKRYPCSIEEPTISAVLVFHSCFVDDTSIGPPNFPWAVVPWPVLYNPTSISNDDCGARGSGYRIKLRRG